MDLVGISEADQQMIFRILAAILHMGNINIQVYGEEESEIDVSKNTHFENLSSVTDSIAYILENQLNLCFANLLLHVGIRMIHV